MNAITAGVPARFVLREQTKGCKEIMAISVPQNT
jgi:hypothetical protein